MKVFFFLIIILRKKNIAIRKVIKIKYNNLKITKFSHIENMGRGNIFSTTNIIWYSFVMDRHIYALSGPDVHALH